MKKKLAASLALCLILGTVVTGCNDTKPTDTTITESSVTTVTESSVTTVTESSVTTTEIPELNDTSVAKPSGFDYSQAFDSNGFVKGVKATAVVKDLFDATKLVIPKETSVVSDEAVQEQIQQICKYYNLTSKVTDREVKKDDKVNIDYVGSVDGKEFEGGNTNKSGTLVTAGSNEYVDTFLTQIIGKKPGETFDVNVTFPADYSTKDLAGKKAKFVTTINYIQGEGKLTDADVSTNLAFSNGWKTVADAEKGIKDNLKKGQVQEYINNYLVKFAETNVDKTKLPKDYVEYYDKVTVAYFQDSANKANMSFNDYLKTYVQVDDTKGLLEKLKPDNTKETVNAIVVQAIAEKEKITVTNDDLKKYTETAFTAEAEGDVAQYEKQFGQAYIKHIILQQKVSTFIYDHAISE